MQKNTKKPSHLSKMMYLLNSLEEIQSHKHILIRMAYSKDLYCDVFFLGIPSQVLFTKNTNKGGFKKNIKQIPDPIVLVKCTLFTGALFFEGQERVNNHESRGGWSKGNSAYHG